MSGFGWRGAILGCLVATAGGMVAAQSRPTGNPEAAKMPNPVAVSPESVAAGKKLYMGRCQFCHGADAKGIPPAGDGGRPAPDLTDAVGGHGSSDGEIFDAIQNGVRPDLFMEPWGDRMSDTDIWNLVNYTRSLTAKH